MTEAYGDTTGSLADGIEAILAELGGRYAVSARCIGLHTTAFQAQTRQEHDES
jgi:hypothetical protein